MKVWLERKVKKTPSYKYMNHQDQINQFEGETGKRNEKNRSKDFYHIEDRLLGFIIVILYVLFISSVLKSFPYRLFKNFFFEDLLGSKSLEGFALAFILLCIPFIVLDVYSY